MTSHIKHFSNVIHKKTKEWALSPLNHLSITISKATEVEKFQGKVVQPLAFESSKADETYGESYNTVTASRHLMWREDILGNLIQQSFPNMKFNQF